MTSMLQKASERRRRTWHRTGATAVELMMALPLLILLCVTSVDFARFAYALLALNNAARVGAEVGATRSYSESNAEAWRQQIENAALEEFSDVGGLDPSKLHVAIEVTSDDYDLHRVTVSTTYSFRTVFQWPTIPRPLDMNAMIVFRRFR
jgi:Flp pilus assembly protein TadG